MGLGFDGVMSIAVHLSAPPALAPVVPFSDGVPDKRWGLFAKRIVRTGAHFSFMSH